MVAFARGDDARPAELRPDCRRPAGRDAVAGGARRSSPSTWRRGTAAACGCSTAPIAGCGSSTASSRSIASGQAAPSLAPESSDDFQPLRSGAPRARRRSLSRRASTWAAVRARVSDRDRRRDARRRQRARCSTATKLQPALARRAPASRRATCGCATRRDWLDEPARPGARLRASPPRRAATGTMRRRPGSSSSSTRGRQPGACLRRRATTPSLSTAGRARALSAAPFCRPCADRDARRWRATTAASAQPLWTPIVQQPRCASKPLASWSRRCSTAARSARPGTAAARCLRSGRHRGRDLEPRRRRA